jgi:ketosteroid isomerase-like protein
MKRKNIISMTMLIAVLFTATALYSQSSSEYKTKIEALNKEMAKNMLEGNSAKSLTMYTDDAISMPSNEPMHDGLAAIKKANEDMAKSGMKFNSFEPTTLKVIPAGNLITEIGTYKISMSMPGMDKPMDDHGKYLNIWEKQKDGSLKLKIETWNSDVDNMGMMNTADQSKMEKKDK